MTNYHPDYRRPKEPGATAFNEQETNALVIILEHMGQEVLTRSEAEPEKSGEAIIAEARKQTLDWLTLGPRSRNGI